MANSKRIALGLDFGTESVRALLVDLTGHEVASSVSQYKHGQITETLPTTGDKLPPQFALQDPQDWLDSAGRACKSALKQGKVDADQVVSIGVDFTSCTMLPALADGTALCKVDKLGDEKFAWPKLWKHHGALTQTQTINDVAARRKEKWLDRYGGIIGLEWFFPKILETLENAPEIYDATEVWLEGGDWLVWQLVGAGGQCPADELPRSTCQAGYKAMWNSTDGYPSPTFFKALDKRMEHVVRDKMPGRMLAPGEKAGELSAAMAKKLGLNQGTAVSAAIIDAHAGVPGAGVSEANTLVMVMGTSSCHMLNARDEKLIPGVAGVVEGGILPGMFGYETGQAAVGDAFDWMRRTLGHTDFRKLSDEAAALPPGADGVTCIDWFNGCRTPLMDGALSGAFTGLTLDHGPAHMYRALLEASAFGVRWIVELLEDGGVPVKKLVATGGLPHHNPLLVRIYADVLGKSVTVHPSRQGPALGAAILGVLAAGKQVSGFSSAGAAMKAMAKPDPKIKGRQPIVIKPDRKARKPYDAAYQRYREVAEWINEHRVGVH